MQMAAGAVGITCQKLGEVEVFVDAGVADDMLLTYNIVGAAKTERLMALARRVTRLAVVPTTTWWPASCRTRRAERSTTCRS